ncbi:ubiquitin carboxyl-terminal hydrolase 2 isoform X2 [Tachysurus ichikawai]
MSPVFSSPKYTTGSTLLSPFHPYDPYDPYGPCNPYDHSQTFISQGHPQPSRYSPSTSRYFFPSSCPAQVTLSLPNERGRAVPRVNPHESFRSESSGRMQAKGQIPRANEVRRRSPSQGWHRSVNHLDLAQELAMVELCGHGDCGKGPFRAVSFGENTSRSCGSYSGPFYWSSEVRIKKYKLHKFA